MDTRHHGSRVPVGREWKTPPVAGGGDPPLQIRLFLQRWKPVATFGVFLTFVVSWIFSRAILKGESSAFSLELPPYRPPQILRTLYTSLIDRTLIVLWCAIVFAAPAGIVLGSISNIHIGTTTLAEWLINLFDPGSHGC
jgi:hypothetical protein